MGIAFNNSNFAPRLWPIFLAFLTSNTHFICYIEFYRNNLTQKEVILGNFKKIEFAQNPIKSNFIITKWWFYLLYIIQQLKGYLLIYNLWKLNNTWLYKNKFEFKTQKKKIFLISFFLLILKEYFMPIPNIWKYWGVRFWNFSGWAF